jgi:sterol desaturase/sphingolipid hydroxylase (fatty acid hydroxylase superfamily)
MADFELRILEHGEIFFFIGLVSVFFFGLIIFETLYDFVTRRRKSLWETLANAIIETGNRLLDRTFVGAVFILGLLMAEPFAFFDIPITLWSWGLAILAADFTYYWMHRIEHERRVLWAVHTVHHSSEEYNLTTSLRLSWVESLFEWMFFVPMVLLGFDVVQVLGALLIVIVYQTWIHTEKIGKLGWLDYVFNTPSVHRVHHGMNAEYIDKNYGGILIIWDHLFGTYKAETEKVHYGITAQLGTSNPLTIMFHEFWAITKDVFKAKSLSEVFGFLFGRPGWRPCEGGQTVDEGKSKST